MATENHPQDVAQTHTKKNEGNEMYTRVIRACNVQIEGMKEKHAIWAVNAT
uniref:Uncharacterized protein n=1 Tax=Octopus bimaculoides TaxID=37653 RepID=A0A0L8HAR1_OCTBM